jgi:hypothetical protein
VDEVGPDVLTLIGMAISKAGESDPARKGIDVNGNV